ncbi:MAG TPA: SNF2-related protein [Ignavibacteriales bacterium]|nr:SNF2-related protein [Ignavibacteriales bacterium]
MLTAEEKKKVEEGKSVENLDDKMKEEKTFKLQGHTEFQGLKIAVENKKGSTREGVDDDGTPWQTEMFYDYGYIERPDNMGADGDKVDCFIGPDKESMKVFIVHQQNPVTENKDEKGNPIYDYDEDKVMLGFDSLEWARDAYLAHYDDQKFLDSITEMSMEEFKKKLKTRKGKMIKAFSRMFQFLKAKGVNFPAQASLFSDIPVIEGQTVIKDGKTYEYRTSKKNPLVKRLFRKEEPDLFQQKEETTPGTKDTPNTPEVKPETKKKPKIKIGNATFDLFAQDKEEDKTKDKKEETQQQNKPEPELGEHLKAALNKEIQKFDTVEEFLKAVDYHGLASEDDYESVLKNGFNEANEGVFTADKDEAREYGNVIPVLIKKGAENLEESLDGEEVINGTSYRAGDVIPLPKKYLDKESLIELYNKVHAAPKETTDPSAEDIETAAEKVKGIKTRQDINKKVKDLLASKTDEEMTAEDIQLLAKYSGRGGLGGDSLDDISLNEFYTREIEIGFMWEALQKLGFKGGRVLEPSAGTGNFIRLSPADTIVTGIEIDPTSARVAKILYQHRHDIRPPQSFEEFNRISEGGDFDAVIGNCPFGQRGASLVHDPEKKDISKHEQYFVDRGIDALKPDGIMGMIVPTGVMDNQWNSWRLEVNKKAEFLGAIRLPDGAFKHANAAVTTDIVFFRKRPEEVIDHLQEFKSGEMGKLYDEMILDADFVSGKYFENNPAYALGTKTRGQFESQTVWKGEVTKEALDAVGSMLKDYPDDYSSLGIDIKPIEAQELHPGDIKVINGRSYRLNENHRWERVEDETKAELEVPDEIKEKLGVNNYAEFDALRQDTARVVELSRDQIKLLEKPYLDMELEKHTVQGDYKNEMLKRAVIIGLEIKDFRQALFDGKLSTTEAQIKAEKISGLLENFKKEYGHPIHNARLDKYFKRSDEKPLVYVAGAFDDKGSQAQIFSDPAAYYKVYNTNLEVGTLDDKDLDSIVSYFFENHISADLEGIKNTYTGDEDVERVLLTSDDIFIDENGNYAPANEICMGEVYEKIDNWERMKAEAENRLQKEDTPEEGKEKLVLRARKLEGQIYELKRRAGTKELQYMPVEISDAGKLFPIEHLNTFLQAQLGTEFVDEIIFDKKTGLFSFKDETLRMIYTLYVDKKDNEKEEKKQLDEGLKSYFNNDSNPIMLIALNKVNGVALPAVRKEQEVRKIEKVNGFDQIFREFIVNVDDIGQITDNYNRTYNNYIQKKYDDRPIEGLSKFDYEKGIRQDAEGNWINARNKAGAHTWATVRRLYEQGKGMIAHGVGLGKAQPLDALILTPKGYVKMGDVYIGQEIINSEGGVSRITGIYPQGELDAYEVKFTDGSKVVCNDEHLWAVRTEHEQARKKPFRVLPLKEIMLNIYRNNDGTHLHYRIPMIQPIQFQKQDVKLDPYLMGLILGDGGITNSVHINIHEKDEDTIEYCKKIAEKYHTSFNKKLRDSTGYSFARTIANGNNEIMDILRYYGLMGHKAEDKFIPKEYLINDIETRLAVLQGLIDTDGYISKDGMTIQFYTVSAQLKEDVKFIIQSFGGIVKEHCKQGKYRNGDELKLCQKVYILTISLPPQFEPVRCKRKLSRYIPKKKYLPNRLIKSVKKIGKAQMQCIMVDSPDHLYATNDIVLTHNTLEGILLCLLSKETGRSKKPLIVTPKSVLLNWAEEIRKWTKDVNFLVVGYTEKMVDGEKKWVEDSKEEKEFKLQRVANEDFDMVLISRDTFTSIDFSPETKDNMMKELAGKFFNLPEHASKKVKKKFDTLMANLAKTMTNANALEGIYLDNLGIDMVIRDEAHDIKNMLVPMEEEIAGISGKNMTQRALHHFFASKIIRGQNGEKGIYSLTATPISNSPLEVFNMMLPFAEKELEDLGVKNMDEFINKFAITEVVPTADPDGRIIEKAKFAGWKSPEVLRKIFFRFTDYMTKDDLSPEESKSAGIKFPKERPNKAISGFNEGQKALMEHCRLRLYAVRYKKKIYQDGQFIGIEFDKNRMESDVKEGLVNEKYLDQTENYFNNEYLTRYDELNAGRDPGKTPIDDTYFAIQSDMIKIASDLEWYKEAQEPRKDKQGNLIPDIRFGKKIDDGFVSRHNNIEKLRQLTEDVASIYHSGGKQIIFAINTNLHENLRRSFIESGIKPEEIAIVNGKTMKGSAARVAVSKAYNEGQYKVIIGNYSTMGEGLNFNKMTSDIHHLQPAWNQLQIEQGNGRGIRQGNDLDFVNTHYYLTKGSVDTFMHDKIISKKNMVEDFMKGVSDQWDDEVKMDDDEMMIALAENPEEAKRILKAREGKLNKLKEEKDRVRNFSQLDQLYTIKNQMAKIDDRESKRFQSLQQEYESLKNRLNNAEKFDFKNMLDLNEKPVIIPGKNAVIPVGSIVNWGNSEDDMHYAVIEGYSPSTGKIRTTTFYQSNKPETIIMDYKNVAQYYGSLMTKADIDKPGMYKELLKEGAGAGIIYRIPKDILEMHRNDVLSAMQHKNIPTMYRTMDGNIKIDDYSQAIGDITKDGGKIIFPQEEIQFPKMLLDYIKMEKERNHRNRYHGTTNEGEYMARALYGYGEWEQELKKDVRRMKGEAAESTIHLPKSGPALLKKLNELEEAGHMNEYTKKDILKNLKSDYGYKKRNAMSSYAYSLREEFQAKYGLKIEGHRLINKVEVTPEMLDHARAIDDIYDGYTSLEKILTGEAENDD